ncbi:MAG: sodium-dependent transporter, partial [Gammaproteobacteria bacterium]
GWSFLIKIFVPLMLSVIFLGDIYSEFQNPYGGYGWVALILIGRDWLIVTLIAAFVIAARPWKTRNHKVPGRTRKATSSST